MHRLLMTQIRLTESITHQRATPAGRRLAFLLLGFKSPLHMNLDVKKKCNTVAPNDPYNPGVFTDEM